MKKFKKIVFIGFLPGFGGTEKSMIMTANGLASLGHEVKIISLEDNNIVYKINSSIEYIFIPDIKGVKIKRLIGRFFSLKKIMSNIEPDVAISFWLQPAIFSSILSKFQGYKTIYSERGDPMDKEYSYFLGFIRFWAFKIIDGFVFQTQSAKACFSKSIQNKSTVINNPLYINCNDFEIPVTRKKIIVNVGRLHNQKNQKLLINAFTIISKKFQDYKLEIYGDGKERKEIVDLISKNNMEDLIILKGTTNNLINEIKDASLFVLSSNYEGMPNALIEAMALGIPCISTNWKPGAVTEIIKDGYNGLIVERDSIDMMVSAIENILENPNKARELGKNAKEICNKNSPSSVTKLWSDYILGLLEG